MVADPARGPHTILPAPLEGLTGFDQAVERALRVVGYGQTPTRWSDAGSTLTAADPAWAGGTEYTDERIRLVRRPIDDVWPVIERIGGDTGWYGFDYAWKLRGLVDRAVGGVGLRRGRRDRELLRVGDSLDFWRVETATRPRHLLLRAEMRVPGIALLEFTLEPVHDDTATHFEHLNSAADPGRIAAPRAGRQQPTATLVRQRASFRPRGLAGRAYWAAMWPIHAALFPHMLATIARVAEQARPSTTSRSAQTGTE